MRASHREFAILFLSVMALGAGCAHRPPPSARATVRYAVPAACSTCDLGDIARRLAGERAVDCGHARDFRDEASRARVQACAREAEEKGAPFLALLNHQGIDSTLIEGFVRAPDGTLFELWYDSDPSGGGRKCNAVVARAPCGRLVPHPEKPSVLTCEEVESPSDTVCREWGYTAGPPEDASALKCDWSKPGRSPFDPCRRVEPGKGNVPPGTVLVCRQLKTGPDAFICTRSAEGAATLGIRWDGP